LIFHLIPIPNNQDGLISFVPLGLVSYFGLSFCPIINYWVFIKSPYRETQQLEIAPTFKGKNKKEKLSKSRQGRLRKEGKDMAHSYISIFIHYVFSTKNREKIISPGIQDRLWAYMGGIARENNMKVLAVGGIEEHVHVLLSLPGTISIAKGVQLIKGGSSKWIHVTFPALQNFAWQVGYGAFSVSISRVNETVSYIKNQKEHHRQKTFQEEYLAFLQRHGIEYYEKYIWE